MKQLSSNKFIVVEDWNHHNGKITVRLVGRLYVRKWSVKGRKFDIIRDIYKVLAHKSCNSGPVMRLRWEAAEQRMLRRYGNFLPRVPTVTSKIFPV